MTGQIYVYVENTTPSKEKLDFGLVVGIARLCFNHDFAFWEYAATHNWARTWQNQQSECARSEDSDQPGHPPSLVGVFAVRSVGS